MSKKILIITLLVTVIITTTACGNATSTNSSETSSQKGTIETTVANETEATTVPQLSAITPENYVEHDNLKFSFEKAKQYDKIKGEYYDAEPKDGKKYLVLFFEVENISKEEQYINIFYSKAYLDDYDIDQSTLMVEPEEGYGMLSGDLAPGKKLKGYLCYEVNPDWEKLEVTYTDGISKSSPKYEFVVTPAELS